MSVLDFIPRGAANAVTAERIAEYMGLEVRAVRRLIQIERLKGCPICASCEEPYGYFVATELVEVEKYVQSLKRRLRNIFSTYNAIQNYLDFMTGQNRIESFFGEGCPEGIDYDLLGAGGYSYLGDRGIRSGYTRVGQVKEGESC